MELSEFNNYKSCNINKINFLISKNKGEVNSLLKEYFTLRCKSAKGKKLEAKNETKLDTIIEEYINLNFINYNMLHFKAKNWTINGKVMQEIMNKVLLKHVEKIIGEQYAVKIA